ncbi:MAG: hypothetical protein H6717_14020 [Polyangiaceae bacterium]|nr:hypothetical protein [Polyangiaceae bacterium]
MRFLTLLGMTALLGATACSSDDSDSGSASTDHATFSDGARAQVGSDGSVSLSVDGRTVLSLTGGVRLARYEETSTSLLGMWSFVRDAEETVLVNHFDGGTKSGDSFVAKLSGDGGAKATVTISPLRAGASLVRIEASGYEGVRSIALPFACDAEASFYGFGEQYNGIDQRGEALSLFVSEQGIGRDGPEDLATIAGNAHTTYYPMPYFLDARGFGALLRTGARVLADVCKTDESVAWLEAESAAPLELVVLHGPTPLDVIRELGDETGRPAPLPDWAFSPWIAVQGGKDAVLAEADALAAAQVPVGALWVQDWTGARTNAGGGYGVQYRWVADETLYPDLAGMIDDLHGRGLKFLGYANPFVMPKLDHFAAMDSQGLLIQDDSGATYLHASPAGDASHPDLTKPEARAYVKSYLAKMVNDLGMDGWMADFGEWVPIDTVPSDGSDAMAAHQRYPIEWHRLSREVMEEQRPGGDFAFITRSGWTGDTGATQITWAGDQECTWSTTDGLPTVVPALLNLGLAAQPYVSHDVAGFSGGPSSKELFLRWAELGAFTPIFRTHEGNMRDQNWAWDKDAETTAHFARMARIHQALAPDFKALAADAQTSSAPILRALMLVFPDDPGSRGVSDELMIGDALLVAPVLTEGATSRSVYLPPGTWFDVWTGQSVDGGQTLNADAPIGKPPVYSFGEDRSDLRAIQ